VSNIVSNLDQLCAEWQEILGLQNWDVVAKIVRFYDLDGRVHGQCSWTLAKREALIKILDPDDYDPDFAFPHDVEKILVYELLHLHFAPFSVGSDTPEGIAQEQAVGAIANALVKLKRNSTKELKNLNLREVIDEQRQD